MFIIKGVHFAYFDTRICGLLSDSRDLKTPATHLETKSRNNSCQRRWDTSSQRIRHVWMNSIAYHALEHASSKDRVYKIWNLNGILKKSENNLLTIESWVENASLINKFHNKNKKLFCVKSLSITFWAISPTLPYFLQTSRHSSFEWVRYETICFRQCTEVKLTRGNVVWKSWNRWPKKL